MALTVNMNVELNVTGILIMQYAAINAEAFKIILALKWVWWRSM